MINADETTYLGINADLISYNLYAYCSNNPIKYVDPTGHFIISLSVAIKLIIAVVTVVAAAATVNDIYQIASGNVTSNTTASTDRGDLTDNVQISDSYKVITPWMQFGYGFYLNHINENTKDVIDGTTYGLTHEWGLHNIAYDISYIPGFSQYRESARSVDVGKTIFSDNHGGLIEHAMKVSYFILNPLNVTLTDLIINGGYN